MARFKRLEVLNAMTGDGLIPVFYNADVNIAKQIVSACADGGCRVVEFTNRGDGAHLVFAELVRHFAKERPNLILGVGSIVDAPTAGLYLACGTNFIVGPCLNEEVARVCNRRKVSYSPGCGSATEISQAEELGVEICKIFPGEQVGGPAFVKAVLGPCPWTCIMPTGGVDATRESVSAWIKAGAVCLGMGSNLITQEALKAGNFADITQRVRNVLGWIREARGQA